MPNWWTIIGCLYFPYIFHTGNNNVYTSCVIYIRIMQDTSQESLTREKTFILDWITIHYTECLSVFWWWCQLFKKNIRKTIWRNLFRMSSSIYNTSSKSTALSYTFQYFFPSLPPSLFYDAVFVFVLKCASWLVPLLL